MSQALSSDDLWKMFQETANRFQETDRKFQETDRKFQETDQKFQETAQDFKELKILFQEIASNSKETDRKIKAVSEQIGKLGGRLGEFVEGLVAPSCETLFEQRGIPVHRISQNMKASLPENRRMEIDIFVVNTDAVALVEVKSKLTTEDVREHLTQLEEFKEFFPEYANRRVFGAVAGMVVEENVLRFAIKNGLYVIVQNGDLVRIANDETFVPRAW